jgi:hypothetical protein
VREIRTLRARWRELETGLRRLLGGHEGGNPGYRQGGSSGLPRQFSTLPGYELFRVDSLFFTVKKLDILSSVNYYC